MYLKNAVYLGQFNYSAAYMYSLATGQWLKELDITGSDWKQHFN